MSGRFVFGFVFGLVRLKSMIAFVVIILHLLKIFKNYLKKV